MSDAQTQCANAALSRMAQPPPHWMTDLCDSVKQRRREQCLHAALERLVQQPQKQCARPLKFTAKRQAVDSKVRETVDALLPRPHWTQTQGRTTQRTQVADPIARACTPAPPPVPFQSPRKPPKFCAPVPRPACGAHVCVCQRRRTWAVRCTLKCRKSLRMKTGIAARAVTAPTVSDTDRGS